MPHLVRCASCRHELRVADDTVGPTLTCPRCLAALPNPAAARLLPSAPLQTTMPVARSLLRYVDAEVRQDTRGTGCGLFVLALLGVPGLAGMFVAMLAERLDTGKSLPIVFTGLSLLFLALLITGAVLSWKGGDGAARGFGRMMVGTLAMIGVGTLMVGALGLAAVVLLFAVCKVISG